MNRQEADDRRLKESPIGDRAPHGHRRTSGGASSASVSASEAVPVVGYATVSGPGGAGSVELKEQAEMIECECERLGLELIEVVAEREPVKRKGAERPGLAYALGRISTREARGLVVTELSRLAGSAADLGVIIEWLGRSNARLVAAAHSLDTEEEGGQLAADLLVEISAWERQRLSERTRNGLQAARLGGGPTGRASVTDNPDLRERITEMRARGVTLQAIADQFNEEGVPTVRGGTKWRHSSVQAAAGYQRRRRPVVGRGHQEPGLE
jgi:DNA invertase Pin-like site-specific DNA recombinase